MRHDGIAFDREEHTPGICAVGTAVAAPDGAVAAITVPLPAQRFHGNEQLLASALARVRDSINDAFGE